jgi:hypothetical protein
MTVPSRIHEVRFDVGGEHVVLALEDKTVQVWSVAPCATVAIFRHDAPATCACFSGEPGVVISGGWDGALRAWYWDADLLLRAACSAVDRDLTPTEWEQYLPGEPYCATRALVNESVTSPGAVPRT